MFVKTRMFDENLELKLLKISLNHHNLIKVLLQSTYVSGVS